MSRGPKSSPEALDPSNAKVRARLASAQAQGPDSLRSRTPCRAGSAGRDR